MMEDELRKLSGRSMSDKKIKRIVRRAICNVRRELFETWAFPLLTRDKVRKMAYFEGKENLDMALAQGRGAIILISHFGFRKLILPALGYEGYKVNQVAANPLSWKRNGKYTSAHNKLMDIELECEKTLPARFIYIEESLRAIFKALSENEIVVIAIDGPVGNKRIGIKFFNRTAYFSPTSVSVSLKTGAPVIPAFVVRQGDNRHKIVIEKPLPLQTDQNKEFAIQEALNGYGDILEKYVIEYPCHYADWLYRARLWPIDEDFLIFQ